MAEAEVSATSGRATFWNTIRGPATVLLTRSASANAMRFGTSSPTTMLRYDTMSVMEHRVQAGRDDREPTHAEAGQPLCKRVRQVRGCRGGREEAHERDSHLDGGQELPRVAGQAKRALGLLVALVGILLRSTCLALTRAISDMEK